MPVKVKCPACKAVQPKEVEYGSRVVCELCGEKFTAPPPPPAPLPKSALPPKPAVAAGPDADFDFEPKAPKYKGESDPDRLPDRPAPRPGRKQRKKSRMWLTCGMVGSSLFLLIVFGCCGIAFYNDYGRPKVPPFVEPANPYKPGTQVNLREVRTVKPPAKSTAVQHLIHSPKHEVLFARTETGVWTFDLKQLEPTGAAAQMGQPSTADLAPDQSVLFVGERTANRLHRYDLAAKKWETRVTPVSPFHLKALDSTRLVAMEQVTWPKVRLWRWSSNTEVAEHAARTNDGESSLAYHPRNGWLVHASGRLLTVYTTDGRTLREKTPKLDLPGGGPVYFSPDGSRMYCGNRQYDTSILSGMPRLFPETILACSRDVAFGRKAYYRADDATLIAEYGLEPPKPGVFLAQATFGVSPDGMWLWVFDPAAGLIRQYAIEGDE